MTLVAGDPSRLARDLSVLLRGEAVYGRVEPVVRRRAAAGRTRIGAVDERRTISCRGVSITAGMDPVDGRLHVVDLGIALFGDPIPFLGAPVALVRGCDQAPYVLVTDECDYIACIGGAVPFVRDAVAFVGDAVPFVRNPVTLIGH